MTDWPAPDLHGSLDELRDAWADLAEHADSIFATWEWLECWWRHFGRDRPLYLGRCRDRAGRTAAIIPMYLAARRPLRVVRLLGHGPSDLLGPICDPADRREASAAWGRLLHGGLIDWDLLLADDLPSEPAWRADLRARLMRDQRSPVTTLSGEGWPAWLATRSRNFRSTLRRARRRLDQHGGRVAFRLSDDPDRLARDVDELMRLHALRWHPAGRPGGFWGRKDFHLEFARTAMERGWLRLIFLEVDRRAVGVLYNFRYMASESFYLSGRDPALRDISVGLLMHAEAIRLAHGDGLHEYRFLRGDEPYKYRFADREDRLESIGVGQSAAGRLAFSAVRHLYDVPYPLRRMVPSPYSWGTGTVPRWGRP